MNCENCYHYDACNAWINYVEILYSDYDYSTEDCPFYKDKSQIVELPMKAIKEFAEQLKKDFCDLEFNANTERKTVRVSELREQMDWVLHTVSIEIINNLVNEMTKEQGNDRLPIDKKNGSRN